jgi:hypothetical protein
LEEVIPEDSTLTLKKFEPKNGYQYGNIQEGVYGLPEVTVTPKGGNYILMDYIKVDINSLKTSTQTYKPIYNPNQNFIGTYNHKGFNEDYLKELKGQSEKQYYFNEHIRIGQELSPVTYGGNGFGVGTNVGIWQGLALAPQVVLTEIAFARFLKLKELRNIANLKNASKTGGRIFTETAREGDIVFYSTKVGDDAIEFGGSFTKTDGILTIKNFDIDGSLTNKLGIRGLKDIINEFGKQQGVKQVIIEGAKRTTGANPGRIPSSLIFNIN